VEQIELEKDKCFAIPGVGRVLDQAEGGRAVRPHPAQLAIKIGLPRRERRDRFCDGRVLIRPVEAGSAVASARRRLSGRATSSGMTLPHPQSISRFAI
jgi:hypothetical protein